MSGVVISIESTEVEEVGIEGRRVAANPSTDSYIICISLESLLKLWRRIYTGTVDKLSYRKIFWYWRTHLLTHLYTV